MLRPATVPTLLVAGASQAATALSQSKLVEAQKELSTGRRYDVGLALGPGIVHDLRLRLEIEALHSRLGVASYARAKAEVLQSGLGSIAALADKFLSTLSGARGAAQGQILARDAARGALSSLTDILNTSYDGQFIFSGTNTDRFALHSYSGGTPQVAVDGAFIAEFGASQSDALVNQIGAADMSGFIDGAFASLFSPPQWQANWSGASNGNLLVGVGGRLDIDLTVNANASFIRQLTKALVMTSELGQGNLGQEAFETLVDKAASLTAEVKLSIGVEQSRIGIGQNQLSNAISKMNAGRDRSASALSALEAVDPYEAAARINMLMSQLESSYAVTGRLSRMSLLNFI